MSRAVTAKICPKMRDLKLLFVCVFFVVVVVVFCFFYVLVAIAVMTS